MEGFSIGQTVYGVYKGRVYSGEIEDRVSGPPEREYSVRTSIWREKKWWKESELSDTEPEEEESPYDDRTIPNTWDPIRYQ